MSGSSALTGTIGIENRDETDGIQYRWNALYDLHAHPNENETAILFTTPVSAPDIIITLTPATTPIVIPAAGGSFDFDLLIENSGSSTVYYDVWFEADLPGGSVYGPIALHEDLTMPPLGTLSRSLNQTVPGNAPAGEYTFNSKIGNYPNLVFVSDSFPFEKRAGHGSDSPYTDWTLTGWFGEATAAMSLLPDSWSLDQNYPNPFNLTTAIRYQLPALSFVNLSVYDVSGRKVTELINGWREAGVHKMTFNASNLASGIYFCRLQADQGSAMIKMVLIK
jgi:hypothetical protein